MRQAIDKIYKLLSNRVSWEISTRRSGTRARTRPSSITRLDQVQAILETTGARANHPQQGAVPLKGLVFGSDGRAMSLPYQEPLRWRYRYYSPARRQEYASQACRLPAADLESAVMERSALFCGPQMVREGAGV